MKSLYKELRAELDSKLVIKTAQVENALTEEIEARLSGRIQENEAALENQTKLELNKIKSDHDSMLADYRDQINSI